MKKNRKNYQKDWYQKNKKQLADRQRERRSTPEGREKAAAYSAAYRASLTEEEIAEKKKKRRKWYKKNKERLLAYSRDYYREHYAVGDSNRKFPKGFWKKAKNRKKYRDDYYQKNKEQILEYHRQRYRKSL